MVVVVMMAVAASGRKWWSQARSPWAISPIFPHCLLPPLVPEPEPEQSEPDASATAASMFQRRSTLSSLLFTAVRTCTAQRTLPWVGTVLPAKQLSRYLEAGGWVVDVGRHGWYLLFSGFAPAWTSLYLQYLTSRYLSYLRWWCAAYLPTLPSTLPYAPR